MKTYRMTGTCIMIGEVTKTLIAENEEEAKTKFGKAFSKRRVRIKSDWRSSTNLVVSKMEVTSENA